MRTVAAIVGLVSLAAAGYAAQAGASSGGADCSPAAAWTGPAPGSPRHVLRTLEFSPLGPKIVERKVYRPRVGVVSEQQLSGGHETLELVHVTGRAPLQ